MVKTSTGDEAQSNDAPKRVAALRKRLGDDLVGVASWHDCLPAMTKTGGARQWLAVIRPKTSLEFLRETLYDFEHDLPIFCANDVLPMALGVAPVMAEQLAKGDLWGDDLIVPDVKTSIAQQLGTFATRLLTASALLASPKLDENDCMAAEQEHRQLIDGFLIDPNVPLSVQMTQLFAALEMYLPVIEFDEPLADAPDCLPMLQAIYEELDSALLVMPSGKPNWAAETDWEAVRQHYASRFTRIQLTTTQLLPLVAQNDLAVAFAINRYRHHWGRDVLAEVAISAEQMLTNAAWTVMQVYSRYLPHGVIRADEETVGHAIHDVQNRLLKVQFQYELLTLLHDIPRHSAPRLHVDRTLPPLRRIEPLLTHIREWITLYQKLLDSVSD